MAFAAACWSVGALPGVAQGSAEGLSSPAPGVLEQARAQQLEKLHRRIGRFASGEVAVYRGDLQVIERRRGPDARRLRSGRVVAALVRPQALAGRSGSETTFTIASADEDLWLRLSQSSDEPGTTRSSALRSTRSTARPVASCTGCLADLAAWPPGVEFHGFAATGRPGPVPGEPVRIEISGRLERVEPEDLRLADVERLNPGFEAVLEGEDQPFTRSGHEGRQRVEGEIRELVEAPEGAPSQMRCERITRYSAERFVVLADPRRFGVRDLTVLGAEVCCFDHGGHGGDGFCVQGASR